MNYVTVSFDKNDADQGVVSVNSSEKDAIASAKDAFNNDDARICIYKLVGYVTTATAPVKFTRV